MAINKLGALDVLKDVFGRILVARSTVDDLIEMKEERIPAATEKSGSVAYYNGQFHLNEFTVEEGVREQEAIAKREAPLGREVEVANVHDAENADPIVAKLVARFNLGVVAPALVAAEHQMILISDDVAYRLIMNDACNIKGTWLQAAFLYARDLNLITASRYAQLLIGLANLRHGYLSIDVRSLITTFSGQQGETLTGVTELLGYLGTKSADMRSHVDVAVGYLNLLWLKDSGLLTQRVTGVIFENLVRYGRDWQNITTYMKNSVGDSEFEAYVDGWIRGHFLASEATSLGETPSNQ